MLIEVVELKKVDFKKAITDINDSGISATFIVVVSLLLFTSSRLRPLRSHSHRPSRSRSRPSHPCSRPPRSLNSTGMGGSNSQMRGP